MRVLVVEDEVRQAAPVQRGLEAEGFAVDVATNDVDGLWMATEQSYDVIVLDVMLPGLNGYRVCAELRARRVATPILMRIAKDGEFDEAEALDTGADDFLSKPFSSVVLVARLRALIRRGGSNRAPLLVVGDLAVDVAGRSCTMAGTPIALTPREFAIIEYLLVHQGEVVAKSDIVSHVWDSAFDGHDNVIETIRSGGYRIRAHV